MNKMKHGLKLISTLILVIFMSQNILAQKSLDDKTLVSIGNENVNVADFMKTYSKNNSYDETSTKTSIEEYLNLYINFKLKVMEAESLQMDTIPSFIKELAGYRQQLSKPYFIDETVNEELLVEAYNRKLYDIRASHILIMVDKNATPADTLEAYNKTLKIREEIIQGKDFAEAAQEYSDDPSAKDQEAIPNKQRYRKGNNGDLGFFTVFNMVYPFENAAYNTPVGEISQAVRTNFGYHLLLIESKTDALGVAQVAHIYVSLRPDASTEDSLRKAEKINNIYAEIQGGMSFEDAVIEFSEDKGSAKKKGQLSKFTSNKVVPEFVVIAKELRPGEISKPVKTLYGFHIVKVISRKAPGTFEEEETGIKEKLAKDNRSHKSEEAVIVKIKKETNFSVNDEQKTEVFASIDSTVLKSKFETNSNDITLSGNLFKIADENHLQSEFIDYVVINQKSQQKIDKDVYLNQLFNKFTEIELLAYEDQHLEEYYPDFADLMQEYHDGILLFNLTDELVWSKAVKDTTGLLEYYETNRDKYMWAERVDATIFNLRNPDDVDRAIEIILQHDNAGDVAKTLGIDSIKSVRIIPGIYEKGSNKYVDKVKWTTGLSSPLKSDNEAFVVLVRINEVKPAQHKKLKEAKGLVTSDYQTYLEKQWIENLKQKYPVNINQEILDKLIIKESTKTE